MIRHADPQRDGPACAGIYAPFVADSSVSFEDLPPDGAEFARRIETISSRYPWLVAEIDGEVAGYAYASPHRDRAAYRWAAEVAVYVGERHRGQGVGKVLYRALFDLLARQGIRTVCAGVTLPNDASIALHRAAGFDYIGVYTEVGFKNGAWGDVTWWQRPIAAPGVPAAVPPEPIPLAQLGLPALAAALSM